MAGQWKPIRRDRARSCGMHAIWVDRGCRGWIDAALPDLQPTAVVHDLNDILTVIQ